MERGRIGRFVVDRRGCYYELSTTYMMWKHFVVTEFKVIMKTCTVTLYNLPPGSDDN